MSQREGMDVDEPEQRARARLIDAMGAVVAEKGYAATTVADVVARAKVSRRTFYEQFGDKLDCMRACYLVLGERLLAAMPVEHGGASPEAGDPRAIVAASVDRLLSTLSASPSLTYTQFVAVHAAGLTDSPQRRSVQDALAGRIREIALHAARTDARITVPTQERAVGLVGGIGELIVRAADRNDADLAPIAPTIVDLVMAVLLAPYPAKVR